MSLLDYGWNDHLAAALADLDAPNRHPGRVILERRGRYLLATEEGEVPAANAGRLRHRAAGRHELPVIGDWVTFRSPRKGEAVARIEALLPRRTQLSRKVAGARAREQVLAANIDTVFLVMSLDDDFSLRRMERLVTMAWESGARPVVVLTKSDLAADAASRREAVVAICPGVPVKVTSASHNEGLGEIRAFLAPASTIVLVGSSGAGKSTLVNHLFGAEIMRTGAVRERDSRGRHTTSHRQLVRLADGTLLIDSPGLREIQLWTATTGLDETFDDILQLGRSCRFRDCGHQQEPGCHVRAAVESGELELQRLDSFQALARETDALALRRSESEQRQRQRQFNKLIRAAKNHKASR